MADYQRLVDDIRNFLHSGDLTFKEYLRGVAQGYSEACTEVNDRLRRCEDFLQRGLRSEAVQYAHVEPNLLDSLTILDMPERQHWEDIALAFSLPQPPRLRMATAEALNRAYAEEQQLDPLLRHHRLLALTQAPLGERLNTIKQIAQSDPNNSVWREQWGEMERSRIQHMPAELDECVARDDLDRLMLLWTEVQQTAWVERPPEPFVRKLAQVVSERNHLRLRRDLEALARDLSSAYLVQDIGRARELRDRWNQLAQQANLSPVDPMMRSVAPTFQWLSVQDRKESSLAEFQQAVSNLEQALGRDASGPELEERYGEVTSYRRAISAGLQKRYEDRLEYLHARAKRREHIILMATFSLGLIALLGFIIFLLTRKSDDE